MRQLASFVSSDRGWRWVPQAGELRRARETGLQALAILDDLCHPDAGQVRAKADGTRS